jgi:hypothetical protein
MSDPERKVYEENIFYAVDPRTILDALEQDNNDVFTLMDNSPYENNEELTDSVQWDEADYFYVAQALHEIVWGESLDGWQLKVLDFDIDCENLGNGPQSAGFIYIKIDQSRDEESRFVSQLIIEPRRNSVIAHKEEIYPHKEYPRTIDLGELKVSLQEVLAIVESNGGAEIREEVEDSCTIFAILNSGMVRDYAWEVSYLSDPDSKSLVVFRIDPLTGEFTRKK